MTKLTIWCLYILFAIVSCLSLLPETYGSEYSGPGLEVQEDSAPSALDLEASTIHASYLEIFRRVSTAVRAQVGDAARLEAEEESVHRFIHALEQQQDHLSSDDYRLISNSASEMLDALAVALEQSQDDAATTAMPVEASYLVYTGRQGRPRREINPEILEHSLDLRGPAGLAPVFNCHPRTVRRRALDYGLVVPCPPVYVEFQDDISGQLVRLYRPDSRLVGQANEELSNNDLDRIIRHIVKIFPSFGRSMITGHLRHLGLTVPRERIREAYERVMGAPASLVNRSITRRVYRVAGPNSLWHHDGQHGLIRYRIVIHGFVDGFSRLVTGIRASNNNRAETVAELFHDARRAHGTPSRVRGDHGVENLQVAEFMETSFGAERGSYIWGRSVHNIRIERLWRDITRDFGRKWKVFFEELEVAGDLHPDNSAHIWLLHYLFLAEVNRDAMEWAETWNSHTIRQGPQSVERQRSPRDMFFFGQLQNGWRDLSQYLPEEDPAYNDDPEGYGVDWEDLGNRDILIHHNVENSAESLLEVDDNSSAVQVTHRPANFAAVEVPVVDCPLTMEQFDMLNEHLVILPTYGGRDMRERRSLWRGALHYINSVIFGGSS